jgi:D-inositol-3-phosphate glycosyltransferase
MRIAVLSAGKDKPYALGLADALISKGIEIDFIGNDEFQNDRIFNNRLAHYFNLRGNQDIKAGFINKSVRVLRYYAKLIFYASNSSAEIFHILWLNKFIFFDCTILNIYFKIMGKKIIYTAHNINTKKRDGSDNFINKVSLKFLYSFVDHILVHTKKSKKELCQDFRTKENKITVIPFPLNSTVKDSGIKSESAKKILKLKNDEIALLFFGKIAPYKGVEVLLDALKIVIDRGFNAKAILAGEIKFNNGYKKFLENKIVENNIEKNVIMRWEFIPDKEIEIYFKAADAIVLPYKFIYQSGPLFLAYNFGLPVISTDVGSFREDIVDGKTGFLAQGDDAKTFSDAIIRFVQSDLYQNLSFKRNEIQNYAIGKYSWDIIANKIENAYKSI